MLAEILLPAMTAAGTGGLGWYLARQQLHAEWTQTESRLKAAMARLRQRNRLLAAQLELDRTRMRLEQALRAEPAQLQYSVLPQLAAAPPARGADVIYPSAEPIALRATPRPKKGTRSAPRS